MIVFSRSDTGCDGAARAAGLRLGEVPQPSNFTADIAQFASHTRGDREELGKPLESLEKGVNSRGGIERIFICATGRTRRPPSEFFREFLEREFLEVLWRKSASDCCVTLKRRFRESF